MIALIKLSLWIYIILAILSHIYRFIFVIGRPGAGSSPLGNTFRGLGMWLAIILLVILTLIFK